MEINDVIKLFGCMKMVFECNDLELKIINYPLLFINSLTIIDENKYFDYEVKNRNVALTYNNIVEINQNILKRGDFKIIVEILIHEITHYLLLPKDTSNHPPEFWEEFDNNCKIWQKKKGEYKCH